MPRPLIGSPLDQPAQFLKGVGRKRAEQLERLGIHSARDLLYHIPRRYEDASTVAPIGSVQVGMDATVIGEVVSKGVHSDSCGAAHLPGGAAATRPG